VVTAVVVWVLYSAVFGFPARLETIFQTLAAATTLAMVFVIQHTQARAQAATQRKLDEILLASPEADNTLITLEEAPDNELKEATGRPP
jgi:low affinity Fe/Cu permease